MATLRKPETDQRYRKALALMSSKSDCALCAKKALRAFTHWKIVENSFPYDRIASLHHMILPLRHVQEPDLTSEENAELKKVKNEYINIHYEYILESVPRQQTVPGHFHLHLIDVKD